MATPSPVLADAEESPIEHLVASVLHGAPQGAAARLVVECGGLAALSRMDAGEIETCLTANRVPRARGRARALASAFELGRRATVETARPPRRFGSAVDVVAWAQARLGGLLHEELWILALDARGHLRASGRLARGGSHGLGLRATDPLRFAIRAAASGFVLVHNHPSGDPTPSPEDVAFTERVATAARVVGLPLVDHVVVARDGFSSVPFRSEEAP